MEEKYEIKPVTETEYVHVGRELAKVKLHLIDLVSLAIINKCFNYKYKKQYRKNVFTWDKVIGDEKLLDFISEIKLIIRLA